MTITLTAGDARLAIAPELGGSLLSWHVGAQPMLRTTSSAAIAERDRLGLASFPLVPFSNRIAHGRFDWNGRSFNLPANMPPEPHRLHGSGWENAWTVCELSASTATLELFHDDLRRWPWPFRAEQRIELTADALELTLTGHNLADEPVPLAFGHHPYFDRDGASMAFCADHVWLKDSASLPVDCVAPTGPFDFTSTAPVDGRDIDHCYAGNVGRCTIRWDGRPLALEIASSMDAAVVYVPPGQDYFCFEPVPHINNAINMPGQRPAMPIIAPGESFHATIRFQTRHS